MKLLIQYKNSSRIIQIAAVEDIHKKIWENFALNREVYFLKRYDDDFQEYIDVISLNELLDKDKIKIEDKQITPQVDLNLNSSLSSSLHFSSADESLPHQFMINEPEIEVVLNLRKENWPEIVDINISDFSKPLLDSLTNKENLSWDNSRELVGHMARYIFQYKPYPSKIQRQQVCFALVEKFPHLKNNIGLGIGGWEAKLQNKLKKIRQGDTSNEVILRRELCASKTKVPKSIPNNQKSGQINWAPDHFPGENESTALIHQKLLIEECNKVKALRDENKVTSLMSLTFSFRRELINKHAPVKTVIDKYPMMFEEDQQFAEFYRVTAIELNTFIENIYRDGPKLFTYYKLKKKSLQEDHFCKYFETVVTDVDHREKNQKEATFGLHILPLLFKESIDEFFQNVDEDTATPAFTDGQHPIIYGSSDLDGEFSIHIEGEQVTVVNNYIHAVALSFSYFYTLNLQYPKAGTNTLHFFEYRLLKMVQGKVPPKVLTLCKNLDKI